MRFHMNCRLLNPALGVMPLSVAILAAPAMADNFFWNSSGQPTPYDWSNHNNWDGPSGQIPDSGGDRVFIVDSGIYDPILDSDRIIGQLRLEVDGVLATGEGTDPGDVNHYLSVTTGVGGTGVTLVRHAGSRLDIYNSPFITDFNTKDLAIWDGGLVRLFIGSRIEVDDLLEIDADSTFSGTGHVQLWGTGINNPRNDGLIKSQGGSLQLYGGASTLFDLDGPGENGALEASDNSWLRFYLDVETEFNGTMEIGSNAAIEIEDYWYLASEAGSTLTFSGGSGSQRAKLEGVGGVSILGVVDVESGEAVIETNATIGPPAQVNLAAGTTLQFDGTLYVEGSPFQGTGQVTMASGSVLALDTTAGIDVPLHNDGHIGFPSTQAFALVNVDAFTQGADGQIDFELCSPQMQAHDKLVVAGAASLDGRLDLALVDTCPFIPGDEFTIITAASVTGQFAEVTGLNDVQVIYDATSVTVRFLAPCPSDLDGDGATGVTDLLAVLAAWGTPGGDVTGDGTTDVQDLLVVLAGWGSCG